MFEYKKAIFDTFEQFLSEHCETGDWKTASSNDLYVRYSKMCMDQKMRPLDINRLGKYLTMKGFESMRFRENDKQKRGWYGIALKPE